MNQRDPYNDRIELLQGTRDMLILQNYRITAKGKKQLASDLGRWERFVEAIGSVMHVKPEESES